MDSTERFSSSYKSRNCLDELFNYSLKVYFLYYLGEKRSLCRNFECFPFHLYNEGFHQMETIDRFSSSNKSRKYLGRLFNSSLVVVLYIGKERCCRNFEIRIIIERHTLIIHLNLTIYPQTKVIKSSNDMF